MINKILKNQSWLKPALLALLLFIMIMPVPALAQNSVFEDINKAVTNSGLFDFFQIVLTVCQAFIWPVLILMGGLLNNDLLFSGGMLTILLNIWSAVRDFVNILFVLGLLAVAIANIIGINSDNFKIKAVVPKIVFALIAVNFSFLVCKVVLDVVNVGTTAIFAVPMASSSLNKNDQDWVTFGQKVCGKMQSLASKNPKALESNPFCQKASGSSGSDSSSGVNYELTEGGKNFFSTFNSRNVALVMAIDLMDITRIDSVKLNGVSDLKSLSINTLFSFIFLVIYGTAFIALFVALLIRLVVLWLAIALSPLSFLGMAFAPVKQKFGNDDPLTGLFMKHALTPLPVALILTIGMIMISHLKFISPGGVFSTNPGDFGTVVSGVSSIQDIMAGLATAAFIWIAAFRALEGTKADPFIKPIQGAVQRMGTSVAKLPLYAPIIPTGKGGKVGLAALGAAGGLNPVEKYIQSQQSEIAKLTGDKSQQLATDLDKVKTKQDLNAFLGKMAGLDKAEYSRIQAKLGEKLAADKNLAAQLDRAALSKAGYNSPEQFIQALKEGKVEKEKFDQFVVDSKIAVDFNVKSDVDMANSRAGAALNAADKGTPYATAAKELQDAAKQLKDAKTQPEVDAAKRKLDEATKKLDELDKKKTDFRTNIKIDPKLVNGTNQVPQADADKFKQQYEDLAKVIGPVAARKALEEALTSSGVDGKKAGPVADNIIKGNGYAAPGAPAVPAGGPPAGAPPPAVP
ncbi:hypothetical protein IT411_02270 [Candidatus Peregrinibacteria bacterium]|nr:hypothetical protein [Candidatus Peregrinibacteria bacterium]